MMPSRLLCLIVVSLSLSACDLFIFDYMQTSSEDARKGGSIRQNMDLQERRAFEAYMEQRQQEQMLRTHF